MLTLPNGYRPSAPGTIGVIHRGLVHADFAQSLACLQTPPGTKVHFVEGTAIAHQRNQVIQQMEGDWVAFIDTDHVFQPDMLTRLLAHRLPVIAPLICSRHTPFHPVCFRGEQALTYEQLPEQGVIEVDAVGTGVMVLRLEAIRALTPPWFRLGQIQVDLPGEDIDFCRRLRAAGIPIRVDCDLRVGHIGQATFWPVPGEGVGVELPGQPPFICQTQPQEVRHG